jgi:hypothetical protein
MYVLMLLEVNSSLDLHGGGNLLISHRQRFFLRDHPPGKFLWLTGLAQEWRKPMLHDITPLASPRLAVWPGDTPLSREVLCDHCTFWQKIAKPLGWANLSGGGTA